MWTTQTLLDFIQELLLEIPHGHYNISSRLMQLNHAQTEMCRAGKAIQGDAHYHLVPHQSSYILPDNFLTLGQPHPRVLDTSGRVHELKVRSVSEMEDSVPGWGESKQSGSAPQYLVLRGRTLYVHPKPSGGTLTIFYYADAPKLVEGDDVPFAGDPRLNEFADALAYRVAGTIALPRSQELANRYLSMSRMRTTDMRSALSVYPQHSRRIRPYTYRGDIHES